MMSFPVPKASCLLILMLTPFLSCCTCSYCIVSVHAGLQQQGKTVKVLEGRSRIGGRMHGLAVGPDSTYVDMGGQWLGPTQTNMLALTKEFGIETFNYKGGLVRLEYNGKRCDYAGDMYFAMFKPEDSGAPDGLATAEEQEDARQDPRRCRANSAPVG